MNELETKAIAQEFAEIKEAFDFVHDDIQTIVKHHNGLCETTQELRKSVMLAGAGIIMLAIGGYCVFKVVCDQQDEINELKKEVQKLKNGRA